MAPWQTDTRMECSCTMRALGLPNIPVKRALLRDRAPRVAHTSHCSGLQPWDPTWEVPQSALSIQHVGSQGRSIPTAQLPTCSMYWLQNGWWGWGDAQLSKSLIQHTAYLRKASGSIWQESVHFLDSYVTRFLSYCGNISDLCVIFLKPFALQIHFYSNNTSLLG